MENKKYLPDLYIEKSNHVLKRLAKLKRLRVEYTRRKMINIKRLDLTKKEKWSFLDRKKLRGRSGGIITFKKETTPPIAQLLGFIITDGSLLSTENRVKLCQRDISLIEKYTNIINTEYKAKLKFSYDGKEGNISSTPLRYILHKYYDIPLGKKVRIVETPSQIRNSKNKKVLEHFIAGLFDGDGYIQYRYIKDRKILDQVGFAISTSSHKLIQQTIEAIKEAKAKTSLERAKNFVAVIRQLIRD